MILNVVHPAGELERFGPHAFDHNVGKRLRVNIGDSRHEGWLIRAEVAKDGLSVSLTIDVPGMTDHNNDLNLCPNPLEVTKWGDPEPVYVCGCVPEGWGRDPVRIGDGPIIELPDDGDA